MRKALYFILLGVLFAPSAWAQHQDPVYNQFEQLKDKLATPNSYRTASGAPGHEYYQQRADYSMKISLDDDKQIIRGEETVTYFNQSPDPLGYLWLQLDQNQQAKDSDTYKTQTNDLETRMNFSELRRLHDRFDGGFRIEYVRDAAGKDLSYVINKTMMRINLPQTLPSKGTFTFKIKWWYPVQDRLRYGGRSGYEYFKEDNNYLYTIAQFFPRMAVYNEVEGWQHKQFLGAGEFTLPFGNYDVQLTVPADHVVAATGVLQNAKDVLSAEQRQRFEEARKSTKDPVLIVTEEEARANEKDRSDKTKTWIFKAENVRDFAFASSRKFIWDAMGVVQNGRTIMAMSMYPKEGNPLWEKYSTRVVAHTLNTYSKFTFEYPYPVAWSIHTDRIGMEYPMICFNGGRPEADGTYSERTKHGMIGVIVHEVGHNYFPMIVNSDERQWTWMDEGLNTFLQNLAEQEWDTEFPTVKPAKIVDYMKDRSRFSPIMTNSESVWNLGANAYQQPATGLYILRETVMGRELFDMAFREYAQRWKFKHPTPEDFFRTMEDASGVDLDWFWRGWFFTNDHVDIALDKVSWFRVNTQNPEEENAITRREQEQAPRYIGDVRNEELNTVVKQDPRMRDFYDTYDPLQVSAADRDKYQQYLKNLSDEEKELLNKGYNYYQLTFKNIGGLVMPLIVEFKFSDGSSQVERIPAEIWRRDNNEVNKVFFYQKEVAEIVLDPFLETADTELNNNYWPERRQPTRFELFKQQQRMMGGGPNPMQQQMKKEKKEGQPGGE